MPDLFAAALRQASTVDAVAHRPWPLPDGNWLMGQTWDDLLFAHWPFPEADLRRAVPGELELDTYEGQGWVGVTPFRISGLRARGVPPLPWLSSFPEINVRTYVRVGDKPGIWFFSLDTSSAAAVMLARLLYKLSYYLARAHCRRTSSGAISYESKRIAGHARFKAKYDPVGEATQTRAGSLERFLAERYCLYALDGERRLYRADIHHPPWRLQPARAEITVNTMPIPRLALPDVAPLLHYSLRQDVLIWPLKLLT